MTGPTPWDPHQAALVITIDPEGYAAVWTKLTEAEAIAVLTQVLRHAVDQHGLGEPALTRRHIVVRRPTNRRD